MKRYRVISPFTERNSDGAPTGRKPQAGEEVDLTDGEGKRLMKARCVEEIEDRMVRPPEDRAKRRRGRAKADK